MRTLRGRTALAFSLLIVTTVSGVALVIHFEVRRSVIAREYERQQSTTDLMASWVAEYVRGSRHDVLRLSERGSVRDLIEARREGDAGAAAQASERLIDDYTITLEVQPQYLQCRFLDAEGTEVVRADRSGPGGSVRVVEHDTLQDKGPRAYFRAAIGIPVGEIYVSPIELNREFGEIEEPAVPVMRIATPVIGSDGSLGGLVIINIDMSKIFDKLRGAATDGLSVYAVNERGDFLVHPDRKKEFGFDYGKPYRLGNEFPGLSGSGAADIGDPRARVSDMVVTASDVVLAHAAHVMVLCTRPYAVFLAPTSSVMRATVNALIPALALGLVAAVWISRSVARPVEALTRGVRRFREEGEIPVSSGGTDEVVELGDTLRALALDVEAKTASLEFEVAERRQAENRFRQTIEASPSGMVVVDEGGRIVLVNKEVERIFKYAREELLGRSIECLVHEGQRGLHAMDRAQYCEAPVERPMGQERDLYGRRSDGSLVPVEIGLNPIRTPDGHLQVLGTVVDITERREARERLASYAKRLEMSNEDLERFAYVVSHDLKAPLRSIASVAEWLIEDVGDRVDDDARENLGLLVDRTAWLNRLIDGILLYSRVAREEPHATTVDTHELVESLIGSLTIPEGITARVERHLPTVTYDATQLEQIFLNLIDNAVRHLGRPQGEIVVSCEREGGAWRFTVRDNGVGIDARHFERIFTLFQTLSSGTKPRGTGIGLSIVKRTVERNGGTVSVTSEEGRGTAFSFTIPKSTRNGRSWECAQATARGGVRES